MRKLMEAVQQINEGWDPEGIAQAIYDDVQEGGSALELAAKNSNEPYRAMVYEFGNLTGLYNAEALDGSEIWNRIIDKLEELFSSEEIEEDDGDVETRLHSNNEFTQDVIKLCDEGEEALMDEGMNPQEQLEVLAQVLQDISNMSRLHLSGRGYASIHEAFGDMDYSGERSVRQTTIKIHELMDEGVMDPRTVADAALTYMSEAEVADMARANDWFYDDEDEEDY